MNQVSKICFILIFSLYDIFFSSFSLSLPPSFLLFSLTPYLSPLLASFLSSMCTEFTLDNQLCQMVDLSRWLIYPDLSGVPLVKFCEVLVTLGFCFRALLGPSAFRLIVGGECVSETILRQTQNPSLLLIGILDISPNESDSTLSLVSLLA